MSIPLDGAVLYFLWDFCTIFAPQPAVSRLWGSLEIVSLSSVPDDNGVLSPQCMCHPKQSHEWRIYPEWAGGQRSICEIKHVCRKHKYLTLHHTLNQWVRWMIRLVQQFSIWVSTVMKNYLLRRRRLEKEYIALMFCIGFSIWFDFVWNTGTHAGRTGRCVRHDVGSVILAQGS